MVAWRSFTLTLLTAALCPQFVGFPVMHAALHAAAGGDEQKKKTEGQPARRMCRESGGSLAEFHRQLRRACGLPASFGGGAV